MSNESHLLTPLIPWVPNLFGWSQRMPWKCYGVLTRNTLLRSANTSVRSTLVFQTSQAVRLKLMGHFLNFQPIFISYSVDSFHPGQKKKNLSGEEGKSKDLIIKKENILH